MVGKGAAGKAAHGIQDIAMPGLGARDHDMRGAATSIHNPSAARGRFVRQPDGRSGCARNRDGGVPVSVFLVWTHKVNECRSEFRLHSGSILLGALEGGFNLVL